RQALLLEGAQVAAGALDPQQLGLLTGDRVGRGALGGRVAAGVVGVAWIGAQRVRALEQRRDGLVRVFSLMFRLPIPSGCRPRARRRSSARSRWRGTRRRDRRAGPAP